MSPASSLAVAPTLALLMLGAGTPALARIRPIADGAPLAPYQTLLRERGPELLAIARAAMEAGAEAGASGSESHPAPDWPAAPAGVFVSLVRGTEVRACVGTPTPTRATLVETLRALAADALTADRRRPPVRHEELAGLRVVISFAGESQPVSDPMLVDPGREGLLVSGARGSIAFLPGEARTVAWALREARRVGIVAGRTGSASFARFPVVVLAEPEARAAREGGRDAEE